MKRQLIILLLLCLGASSLRAQDTTAVRVVVPHRSDTIPSCRRRPVNDYPGLNSLMRRLANPGWNGLMKDIHTGLKLEGGRIRPLGGTLTEADAGISSVTSSGSYVRENAEPLSLYLRDMEKGEVPVGPPVLVFFRLAGSYITDSATGSPEKKTELALARAEQVAKLMREGCPGGEDRGLVRGRDCLLRTPLRESELPDRAVRLLRPMIPER